MASVVVRFQSLAKKTLYVRGQNEPFELSRSKVDLFLQCPKCFYLDRSENYRIARPGGPIYLHTNGYWSLLLKKEFDIHRQNETVHPYCEDHSLSLIPFKHNDIEEWQNNRKGIRYHHKDTNLIIYGAIDDCWRDNNNVLHIVDYKSTTASYDPKTLEIKAVNLDEKGAPHKYWYKKQVEIYQWLFSKNDFDVSNTAYFVFASALIKTRSIR